MKRRLYVDPESGLLEDCSASPDSWESSFCVVLRGNEDLWQRYLDAERARGEARQAVLDAAIEEPMTAAEHVLHERDRALSLLMDDLDWSEWLRRNNEIKEAARLLAESADGVRSDAEPSKT